MWLVVVRGMSVQEIASVLFICEKSVHCYLPLFHSTGSVAHKQHTGGPNKALSDFEQFAVLQTLIHHPTSYLHEIPYSPKSKPPPLFDPQVPAQVCLQAPTLMWQKWHHQQK